MYRKTKEGLLLSIKVIASAKNNKIVGWQGDFLKVHVAAQPEKGKANKELILFLAKVLHLPQSNITIQQGATSDCKTVLLTGISEEQLTELFRNLLCLKKKTILASE